MNLIINQAKLKSCILDDRGEIKLPKFLSESHLMELSKEIFKLVVGYCFEAETDTVPGSHLNVMLDDNQIDFDRHVVKALIELSQNDYLKISNI